MDEADFLDRTRRVAEARPAAPIDRRDLFSGRGQEIANVFSVFAQPGQHAVVYGERGVGKTSLGLVTVELLRGAKVLSAWATCDASDDFSSVWRKALGEIGFATSRHVVGFGERVDETIESASQLLGPGQPGHAARCPGGSPAEHPPELRRDLRRRVRPLPGSGRAHALRRHDQGPLGSGSCPLPSS